MHGDNAYNRDDNAFLFSVKRSKSSTKSTKMPFIAFVIPRMTDFAMYSQKDSYLMFGADKVISIYKNGYVYTTSNTLPTYSTKPGEFSPSSPEFGFKNNKRSAKVIEVEVFQLT